MDKIGCSLARASEAKGPFPGGKRVGSRGKKKKKCGCKSIGIKENPTHFKEMDGERFFQRILNRLADEDTAGVSWVAAVE